MRIPKIISNDSSDFVKEETIKIGYFQEINMEDNSWQEDEKSFTKAIKKIEKFVRSSTEYREYIRFLKEEIDMNQCAFFKGITREDASLEIHHSPLTLYDITTILFNYVHTNNISCTPFDVAEKVMEAHFEGLVGLIPLTYTVHELVHNGDIFIPVNYVYGDVKGFYEKYKDYFTQEQKDLLKQNIEETNKLNLERYNPSVLERKYTYLEVDGMELPKAINIEEEQIA